MNSDAIEGAVAAFLGRREADPTLTPEAFLAEFAAEGLESETANESSGGVDPDLLQAIRAAIEIEQLLPGGMPMPQMIGPYRVLREIGRGGMGIVYEVVRQDDAMYGADQPGRSDQSAIEDAPPHALLPQRFALKLHPISPLLATRASERLRREIEALAGVSHENIVRIRDSGEQDGAPYIVMDLVDGLRLDEAGPTMPREDAVRVTEVLARAVHEAHVRGVIHRDLKPQNVILRGDGAPILVDFGLSLSEDLPSLTVTGELLGTPRYMAPEQVRDATADARTDVYALGLILYELVTRRPARAARSREGLLREASDGSLIGPRRIDATIPKPLERILLQALAVVPADRYESAAAFADDLARFRAGERVLAHRRSVPGQTSRWQPSPRSRVAIAGAFVFVAAFGWWAMKARSAASAERKATAVVHLRRAVEHHLDGDSLEAVAEARVAASFDPRDISTQALSAHLSGGELQKKAPTEARELREVLRAFDAHEFGAVRQRLPNLRNIDPGLRAVLVGSCAGQEDETIQAEQELFRASQLLPNSVFVLERLAEVYRKQGRLPPAHEVLTQATAMDSTSADLWLARAKVELMRRDLNGGLHSIEMARRFGDSTRVDLLLTEATLRSNSAQAPRARELLRQVLASNPNHAEAWYQLAYAHDIDHQLPSARDAYERACDLEPGNSRAWSCLANLYSGASRGQCHSCDTAYAAHPEMLDFEKAEATLLRTLEADRGREEWITDSALDIAMRLRRRDRVISLLDTLTAQDASSPAGLRLAELLRRLQLTSQRG